MKTAALSGLVPTMLMAGLGVVMVSGAMTPVRFVSEHISVAVGDDVIEVDGVYEYRNAAPWPTALRLGIPFPIDDDHREPRALALDEVDARGRLLRRLNPAVHGGDVSVRFLFMPHQERHLRLRYSQPTGVPWGRYILTTTREWKAPLERAVFELSLPVGVVPTASNYELESLPGPAGRPRFGFERTAFWPDEDWEFAWHEEDSS